MMLHTMLYIMLVYLLLFAALSNAVCLYNAFFCYWFLKCFLSSCFVLVYWHIVCLFQVWFSIMRSAFDLLVFPNSMFTPFFMWKDNVLSGEIALKNNHYYYYYLFTGDLTVRTMSSTAGTKSTWPRGSPCWTPVVDWTRLSPNTRSLTDEQAYDNNNNNGYF